MGELTLDMIHNGILREMNELERLVEEIREAGKRSAIADATHKTDFSEKRLQVRALYKHQKMTVDQIADIATSSTDETYTDYVINSNNLMTLREALRASQARLDGWRTLAVSFRNAGG